MLIFTSAYYPQYNQRHHQSKFENFCFQLVCSIVLYSVFCACFYIFLFLSCICFFTICLFLMLCSGWIDFCAFAHLLFPTQQFVRLLSTFFPPRLQQMGGNANYKLLLHYTHTTTSSSILMVISTSNCINVMRHMAKKFATYKYLPFWLLNGDQIANTSLLSTGPRRPTPYTELWPTGAVCH